MIFAKRFLLRVSQEGDAPLRLRHTEREYVTVRKETQVGVMDSGAWTHTAAGVGGSPQSFVGGSSQQLSKRVQFNTLNGVPTKGLKERIVSSRDLKEEEERNRDLALHHLQ